MWPSLALQLPVFIVGLAVNITFALLMAFFRASLPRFLGSGAVRGDDVDLGPVLHHRRPIPVLQGLESHSDFGLRRRLGRGEVRDPSRGGRRGERHRLGSRWYRTIFLEEMGKDYVRTARAKGLAETAVMFEHVLKNGMIPILTGAVVVIPTLFMGALIAESSSAFGLGSYTIDAIQAQDFSVVRSMVFLGSVLYILGLLLTDISYTLVDPRVRLE